MKRSAWLWFVMAGMAAVGGCGRPTLPGQQFQGERAVTSTAPPVESPLPEKPILEWGPAEAKVRVVAFYAMDDAHRKVLELVKGFAARYPGKVYAKYVDYRTREGMVVFQRAEMKSPGVMINGESSATIEAKPYPYQVDFVQEMGRYWTADDLEKAVAQAVARAYGGAAAGAKAKPITK